MSSLVQMYSRKIGKLEKKIAQLENINREINGSLEWHIEANKRYEMTYENTGSVMNRRHQIDKIERYEKALFALLDLGYEADMDVITDIITDTLGGYSLLEQYDEHAEKGEKEFKKHYYID